MQYLEGQCLCGAVKVTATAADEPKLRACNCVMCRRHNSAAFVTVEVDQDSIKIEGPVKVFRSSEWAQRAFCETCGSTLWYGLVHDGSRHLAAGLFDNAAGGTLVEEYFSDQCPQGYAFAGDHKRLTREETYALFAPGEGEAQ
ncbi:GFA family protein [Sulfitobacter sp. JBTF-M27]|uniref:GFA family protein n=1 Tax=Sulfitobacter sediminilitoris TaxID=2698830 RepID=A0A6P0C7E1_9RHOB|nr:GFA family protein [Sulfitobacter sediminilitoris]NEK21737.1 GFA family protein [Sulfitobacter sediminilitoris]